MQQLERILGHTLFRGSQRLSLFLRFAVVNTIAGLSEQLKESVMGAEVFGRGPTYNPQTDPIVRIMAGRLRSKLMEYYQSDGAGDSLIIEIPRGGYTARFSWRKQPMAVTGAIVPEYSPTARPPRSHAVGREQELGRIASAFATVSHGTGVIVMISGEAGIGKTTIAEEFLAEVGAGSATAWVGRGRCCERLAETDAFAPILESLDGLVKGDSGGQAAQMMKTTAPTWYLQLAPRMAEASAGLKREAKTASHERMRREFVSFLEGLSRSRPVVLFLDDLHWADASSCDLLAFLGSRIPNIRILLLATYRPGAILTGQHPFLSLKLQLERRDGCQEVALSLLRLEDIKHYIARRFPGNGFPREFVRLVHQRSEGNPLFMTDMLRFLQARRIVVEQDRQWILDGAVSNMRDLIPVGIQSMIQLKINELSVEDRRILLCGAIQGIEFDSAVLAQVLSLDPVEAEERLQQLDRAHDLVRKVDEIEFPDHTFSVRYRFVHAFYQNVLSSMQVPSRRVGQSLETARALVSFTGEFSRWMAADLALLFESGRDFACASQYFLQAARNAARVFAYPEAAILCRRGLSVLVSLPGSGERDEQELLFSLTLGLALMATRGYAAPEVEKIHQRSRELCIKLNETRRLSSVLWGLHTCHINRGDLTRSLEVAREMRQVADASGDPLAVVESLHALGTTLAFIGRLVEARDVLERIFAIYPVNHHAFHGSLYVLDPCVSSLSMLARLLAVLGYLDRAVEKALAAVELAKRLMHPPSLAYATFWVGWIHHSRGEGTDSRRHLESAMEFSRKQGLFLFLEWGRFVRGAVLTRAGEAAEGISEIRKSIVRQDEMGSMLERSCCLTLLAEALGNQGACQEALALCDEALDFAQRTEGRWYEPETHRVRGEILLALGEDARLKEAEAEFEWALRSARQMECRLLELKAALSQFRLHRKLGGPAGRRTVLDAVLACFAEGLDSPMVCEARRSLQE
jgi:tetratricopeptide (TPR) repeat protein